VKVERADLITPGSAILSRRPDIDGWAWKMSREIT